MIDFSTKIYIAPSKLASAGRGVFAKEQILKGELIESCPIIALPTPKERDFLRKTELVNYYFLWGTSRDHAAICLGWGSIYNHSFSPNARYEKVMDDNRMDFYAMQCVEPGQEITVNYNGDPRNTSRLRIPGIPHQAGGPKIGTLARLIDAVSRRLNLAFRYIFK